MLAFFTFLLASIVFYALYLATRHWFPEVLSEHGQGVQRMLNYTLVVTGIFFILGHFFFIYLLLRGNRNASSPHVSPKTEKYTALITAFIMALVAEGGVLVLGLPVWGKYYGPPPQNALTIEVTGRQFMWVFRYPGADNTFGKTSPTLVSPDNEIGLDINDPQAKDDIVIAGLMKVPVDRPIQLLIKSMDVIHSFFLPEFRVKQDAVPGMTIRVWFVPKKTGTYEIVCNQICGNSHYRMRAVLEVLKPEAFQQWLEEEPPLAEYFEEY